MTHFPLTEATSVDGTEIVREFTASTISVNLFHVQAPCSLQAISKL